MEQVSQPKIDGEELLQRKCTLLKRKCDEFEEMNSALFAKTKKIREMIESAEAEKRFLVMKLEQFEDVQFSQPPMPTPLTTHTSSLYTMRNRASTSSVTLDPSSPSATPTNQTTTGGNALTTQPSAVTAANLTSAKVSSLLSSLISTKPKSVMASTSVSSTSSSSSAKTKKIQKAAGSEKHRKETGVSATRKKKGDIDPNAPKKPSNAFFWFCQELRPSLQEHFKGEGVAGQHDLTKVLAKLWSEATAEEKKVYYERYAEDKQRYNRQMQEYAARQQQPGKTQENPGTTN